MENELDKRVYDFRQALGQQSFYAFERFKENLSDVDACQLVVQELDRIRYQFTDMPSGPSLSLEDLESELSQEIMQANQQGDVIRVMEIEDDLGALRRVRSVIKKREEGGEES